MTNQIMISPTSSELKVGENIITDPNLIAEHFKLINTLLTLDCILMRITCQMEVKKPKKLMGSLTPTCIFKLIINSTFLLLK